MIKIPVHPTKSKDRRITRIASRIERLSRILDEMDRLYYAVNLKLFKKMEDIQDR